MGKKPALRDPGKTALNNLLVAIDRVNAAVNTADDVTEHFTGLMISVANAADDFAAKETDATNIQLMARSGQIYTRDKKVKTREKLTVQFDYHTGTGPVHYVLP